MNNKEVAEVLSKMPPLPHSVAGQPFDIEKSEVLKWFLAQPGAKNWVFTRMRGTNRIEYDQETGLWRGVTRNPVGRPPNSPEPELPE